MVEPLAKSEVPGLAHHGEIDGIVDGQLDGIPVGHGVHVDASLGRADKEEERQKEGREVAKGLHGAGKVTRSGREMGVNAPGFGVFGREWNEARTRS